MLEKFTFGQHLERLFKPARDLPPGGAMSFVLRLKELMPLLDDIMALDREVVVGASEGEVAFRIHEWAVS